MHRVKPKPRMVQHRIKVKKRSKPKTATSRSSSSSSSRSSGSWPNQTPVPILAGLPRVWQRIAMCESGGQLHQVTGDYVGLWQLRRGFYRHFGIDPMTATVAQQYRIVQYVYRRQGFAAWSCASILGIS